MEPGAPRRLVLIRHGETGWSRQRRHTGRTDIPLDDEGRARAAALRPLLAGLPGIDTATILVSPLRRARETAELAGLGDRAEMCDDLLEWDYGTYEGRRTVDIREEVPGWSVWHGEIPDGETLAQVTASRRPRDRPGVDTTDGARCPCPSPARARGPLVAAATGVRTPLHTRAGQPVDPRPRTRGASSRALEPRAGARVGGHRRGVSRGIEPILSLIRKLLRYPGRSERELCVVAHMQPQMSPECCVPSLTASYPLVSLGAR